MSRLAGAGLLPGLLGACYSYELVPASPAPQARVAMVLNDQGRVEASPQVGSQVMRIEGAMVSTTDSAYLLAVSAVKPITGNWQRWAGEQVSMRRNHVAMMYERRVSKGRTALLGGAVAALLVAMVSTNLFGIAGGDAPIHPPGEPGPDQ